MPAAIETALDFEDLVVACPCCPFNIENCGDLIGARISNILALGGCEFFIFTNTDLAAAINGAAPSSSLIASTDHLLGDGIANLFNDIGDCPGGTPSSTQATELRIECLELESGFEIALLLSIDNVGGLRLTMTSLIDGVATFQDTGFDEYQVTVTARFSR